MTRAYLDASAMLSILLDEPSADQARELWETYQGKVSSILVEAECEVTLRRYAARAPDRLPPKLFDERIRFFRQQLESVTLRQVDGEILAVLRDEPVLADCRTLDALHLATALLFRRHSEDGLIVVSFDKRLRETASRLGLDVQPE